MRGRSRQLSLPNRPTRFDPRSPRPAALLLLLTLLLPALSAATPAADLIALTNRTRAQHHLSTLAADRALTVSCRSHARHMASRGAVWHRFSRPPRTGENVGMGPDAATIHDGFLRSPSHRRIILLPSATRIGIGAVHDGEYLYVCVLIGYPVPRAVPRAVPDAAPRAVRPHAPAPEPPEPPSEVAVLTVRLLLRMTRLDAYDKIGV